MIYLRTDFWCLNFVSSHWLPLSYLISMNTSCFHKSVIELGLLEKWMIISRFAYTISLRRWWIMKQSWDRKTEKADRDSRCPRNWSTTNYSNDCCIIAFSCCFISLIDERFTSRDQSVTTFNALCCLDMSIILFSPFLCHFSYFPDSFYLKQPNHDSMRDLNFKIDTRPAQIKVHRNQQDT